MKKNFLQSNPVTMVGRNILLGALVFLPVFLVSASFEVWLRGGEQEAEFAYHLGGSLIVFIAFLLPVVAGSVVHSLALLFIPKAWPLKRRRVTAVVLAPLLPVTVLMIGGLGGAAFIWVYFGATIVSTVAYGLTARLPDPITP